MNIKNGVCWEVAVCTDWVTHSPAGIYATPFPAPEFQVTLP